MMKIFPYVSGSNPFRLNTAGSVLPSILGVLVLILVISSQLSDTVLSNHKTNQAYKAQLQAEARSEFALDMTERELMETNTRPTTIQALAATNNETTQIAQGVVWPNTLNSYELVVAKDRLTNESVDWSRQPTSWWENYGNAYSPDNAAANAQTAYSIVEEYEEDFSGSDLGQARDHYSGPARVLYQITARGEGGAQGISRLRTIVAKVYRE